MGSGIILHTTNGGNTWTQDATSLTSGKELIAVYFTSEYKGYVVGNDIMLKYGEISGIKENEISEEISIYPNPTNNGFNIQLGRNDQQIDIFNSRGQAVYQEDLNITTGHASKEFDISFLTKGLYLIKVIGERGVKLGKVVKN